MERLARSSHNNLYESSKTLITIPFNIQAPFFIARTRVLTEIIKTVNNCIQHGVVTARLHFVKASQRFIYFKNIYFIWNAFWSPVTVDIFEMEWHLLEVHKQPLLTLLVPASNKQSSQNSTLK
jgi:hypothetical protein